jgi:hypothetical protein
MADDADEAAEFWATFERETGEKVQARSIGELYEGGSDPGTWGLLVLTDKSLHFKFMPSDNWISSLFRGVSRKSGDKKLPDNLVVPRDCLIAVERPKRGLFGMLFGPAFPRFRLVCRAEGGEASYFFSADPSTGIIDALEKAVPSA